jgi:hypothetical protein
MKTIFIMLLINAIMQDPAAIIFDFNKEKSTTSWFVVNDGVMGGLSKGTLTVNDDGNGFFTGYVTTENNGGFSSIRYEFNEKEVSTYSHIVLKIKGDGKKYQFRIKEKASQRFSYISEFTTSGAWETIKIPLREFYPSFRGYTLNKPNFSGNMMEEIGILIGNKKKEVFSLEIKSITLE